MKVQNSDWQLLRDYTERGSQTAFATLVERHVNFVYSTCLREVRDAVLAEDVTQVVFLILARKAAALHESGTLSGWLYKTSCFACKNAMKQERNRQRHEQNLMQEIMAEERHSLSTQDQNSDWMHLEALLHDALSQLNSAQRDAIFLRFFEGKSVRETGEALGITEKAAERRLARALEKMRRYFAACGYTVSAVALGVLLGENAVQAAPAACFALALQLAGTVATGGAVTSIAATTTQVASLSQGVLKAMLISQIKTGVVASLGFSIMAASTVKIAHYAMAAQEKNAPNVNLRVATTESLAKNAKKEIVKVSSPATKRAPRVLLAQPTLPLKPAEKPIEPQVEKPAEAPKPVEQKNEAPKPEKPQPIIDDIRPQAGEIAVEGPLIAVNNGRLIVDVTSYTLPNGKANLVNPPKPKAILFDAKTPLHLRGAPTPIQAKDLGPDSVIRAVGTDKGTGEPLPARDIAVWKNTPQSAPPNMPPQKTIIETVDAADVPPDMEKRPFVNYFPQGDFQSETAGQLPRGWTSTGGIKARVQEKNGKKWLAISNNSPKNWATMRINVPIAADWKTLRVVAQLKTKNLKRAPIWWQTARLDFNFFDAKNNHVNYGRGLNLFQDSDWTTLQTSIEVPEGATQLSLEPGLFYSTGEVLIDDIHVEANVPLDARPIREGFPEGTFEKPEGAGFAAGFADGFAPWTPEKVQILEERAPAGQRNHFVRLTSAPPNTSQAVDGRFALPPDWKRVRVRAKIRLTNYVPGKNPWETAKINIVAEDEWGKRVGNYLVSPEATLSKEWKTIEAVNPLPDGAKNLHVQPQIIGSIGVFDVDDITITDASDEELPHFDITPDLPDGAFENLDEKDWPRGWIKEAGKPEVFQTAEENGNHFLRLSSAEPIYAAAKGRFKLPLDWRGLKIKGRVRVKNLAKKPGAQGWETSRVGFTYQNAQGARAGGFQQSLELQNDSAWKELEVQSDIPRDAVYIEIAVLLNGAAGVFDVDDLKLEKATPTVKFAPIHEWTREFPEGTFEHQDENGAPLHWELDNRAQILEEDGNKFLRLTSESIKNTLFVSGAWKIKPEWKSLRVRARMRGANLKKGASPFDGARMQIIFMDANDAPLATIPPPLELKKDSDWVDLQTVVDIAPGATSIKLLPSLSRSSGIFDVDDILIEPLTE